MEIEEFMKEDIMFNVQNADRMLNILPLKKQEETRDAWLKNRLDVVLKEAMKKANLTMWIVISKEYNEDPVVESLTPSLFDSTRRLGIFVFCLDEEKNELERFFIGGSHPGLVGLYEFIWEREYETQWERVKKLVEEKQPTKIGVNQSKHIAVADGLSHSAYEQLRETLGSEWSAKLVSAEQLVIHWFLKRSDEEMMFYPFLADLTQNLARTILSNEVINPGVTKTNEVVDWIRQKVSDLGIKTSFYPTIDVQRKGAEVDRLSGTTILPGDIVHLDLGLDYLGLSTDMQQLAYVLKKGETKPPEGLRKTLEKALVMEDIVQKRMVPGATGNEVFESSMQEAENNSIQAMLYSHPVGRHCHEAGPAIGMFDKQGRIPFKGDLKIVSNSAYALEFNVKAFIPEWQQETYIFLEQPIGVYEEGADYLTPRQKEFYLIR